MLRYMLDSNLCIRVLRDRPAAVRERFNREADGLCISSVVLMELLHGAEKSARVEHHRRAVEDFAAAHAAEIRAELERRGQRIGAYDLQIAGHARSQGLIVVTGNLDEFRRVDGLRSEDWLTERH
jgi:tRNA(fMet)-specific endonuclease VapC